jgi:hypothetical protein
MKAISLFSVRYLIIVTVTIGVALALSGCNDCPGNHNSSPPTDCDWSEY